MREAQITPAEMVAALVCEDTGPASPPTKMYCGFSIGSSEIVARSVHDLPH
jgi:hypothetical protein